MPRAGILHTGLPVATSNTTALRYLSSFGIGLRSTSATRRASALQVTDRAPISTLPSLPISYAVFCLKKKTSMSGFAPMRYRPSGLTIDPALVPVLVRIFGRMNRSETLKSWRSWEIVRRVPSVLHPRLNQRFPVGLPTDMVTAPGDPFHFQMRTSPFPPVLVEASRSPDGLQ